MKVTFHQLKVFECVARRLSFTRAAEEMSLSQPTVSAQIRQLSDEVGLPLFEQIGKSVNLTAAGRELLAASRQVFDHWSRFEMTVANLRGLKSGRLALACATTAKYFTPDLIGPFCQTYPEVDAQLTIVNHDALVERLRANLDDLTIMTAPPEDVEVEKARFRSNPIVVVASINHPLAGRKSIPLERLKNERFILRETGSGTRARVLAHFEREGFVPEVRMELGSNEAIKESRHRAPRSARPPRSTRGWPPTREQCPPAAAGLRKTAGGSSADNADRVPPEPSTASRALRPHARAPGRTIATALR